VERKQTVSVLENILAEDLATGCFEIGILLRKSEQQVAYLCRTGQVPAFKEGGCWKMRPSRYRRHIEQLEDATIAARACESRPATP